MILVGGERKGKRYVPEPLCEAEIAALTAACTRGALGLRAKAAIVLMARAGLRVAELVALRICDLDLAGGTVRVLRGKGCKARTVGLAGSTVAVVGAWVDRRRALGLADGGKLISTLRGEPVATAGIRSLVRRLGAKAGIAKACRPHGLRHSYAVRIAEQLPIHYVMQLLGHSSLATTQKYLGSVNAVEAARRLQW